MESHHCCHIIKTKSVALYIVQVAVGHTIELVEDVVLVCS